MIADLTSMVFCDSSGIRRLLLTDDKGQVRGTGVGLYMLADDRAEHRARERSGRLRRGLSEVMGIAGYPH